MNRKMRKAFCPQCGSGDCVPTATDNQFHCQSCGTQFAVSINPSSAPAYMTEPPPQTKNALSGLKWVGLSAMLMAAVAATVLPSLLQKKPAASARMPSEKLGRPEDSALLENSGSFSFIQLYSDGNEQQTIYRSVVSDMQTGKRLAEPQEFRFPRSSSRQEFKYLEDGNLYLLFMERQLWRFDPGAMRFVDITAQLADKFPQQLGVGITKITYAYRSEQSLNVTSADGTEYRVYWLSGQILNDRGESSAYAKAVKSYTQQRMEWRLLPLKSDSIRNARYVLAQTWNRWEPGQMYRTEYVELFPESGEDVQSELNRYSKAGGGFRVKPYLLDEGFIRLEPLDTQTSRFNARVLAQNDQRLLLSYTPTPDDSQGQVLQILDKANRKIIWSRTRDQVAPLASIVGNWYGQAMGLSSGFYIKTGGSASGFLLANDGSVMHDFSPPPSR